MGLRGPAPKPTAIRKREGNPSRRPLPQNEPAYDVGLPSKPASISPAAEIVWDELVEEMTGAAVLRRVDQRALWQLCEDEAIADVLYSGFWNTLHAIEEKAKAEKKTLPGGPVMAFLSMSSGRLTMAAIRDLAGRVIIERREFGLTPSSRSRIETAAEAAGIDSLEMKLCG